MACSAAVAFLGSSLLACGPGKDQSDTSPGLDGGTVVETTEGTLLCEGEILESAPPQCTGPVITNWDWETVWGELGEPGGRWGDFCFGAERSGDALVLVSAPRPADTCEEPEVVGSGLVLESDGQRGAAQPAELCLGAVAASLPPGCTGPRVANWDWERVDEAMSRGGTTWGSYRVHGVYVDHEFWLTRAPETSEPSSGASDPSSLEDRFAPLCQEPEGGWFPEGGPVGDQQQLDAAARRAEALDDYASLWISYSERIDGAAVVEDLDRVSPEMMLNVRVTGDVEAAERALAEVWDGPLCVTQAERSARDLEVIVRGIQDRDGVLSVMSTHLGRIEVAVVIDLDGVLQREMDERFGSGLVEVTAALVEAEPLRK